MSDREKILGRIRDALRVPAPRPGVHGGASLDQAEDASRRAVPDYSDWLPIVGKTFAERSALFARNAAELKAEFFVLADERELPGRLAQLAAGNGWKRIATHRGSLTGLALQGSTLPVGYTDEGYQVADMEASDAGLTECEALVAQTGSVLVSSLSSGGRALSVLPPHHVVVARASQMLADLSEAFALLKVKYGENYPSFLSFISGPSRTGDIERILVLGAHGPKRLTIFCLP
jgi:L-lactate dehydrogenase complex protein LldG